MVRLLRIILIGKSVHLVAEQKFGKQETMILLQTQMVVGIKLSLVLKRTRIYVCCLCSDEQVAIQVDYFIMDVQGTHTLNLSGSVNGNPYFKHMNISNLPLNVWCLSVGYIHANNDPDKSSYGGGLYRIDNGKKLVSYQDFKMGTSGVQTHRTYLYYSTSPALLLIGHYLDSMKYVVTHQH